jgi:hemerythrin-like metal-binding protein
MGIMTWTHALSVGVESLDEQHKTWIDMVNQLFDAMKVGKGREKLESMLDQVVEFARMHFAAEERAMLAAEYGWYAQHKVKHDEFLKKMTEMQQRQKAGALTLSMTVLDMLRDWIIEHVNDVDKGYGPCLTSKGIR